MSDKRVRYVIDADNPEGTAKELRAIMANQNQPLTVVAKDNEKSRRQLDRYLNGQVDSTLRSFVQLANALGYDVALVYPEN